MNNTRIQNMRPETCLQKPQSSHHFFHILSDVEPEQLTRGNLLHSIGLVSEVDLHGAGDRNRRLGPGAQTHGKPLH